MTKEELAAEAYRTWDVFGGQALGRWGGPYVLDAWLEVVDVIRNADLDVTDPDESA